MAKTGFFVHEGVHYEIEFETAPAELKKCEVCSQEYPMMSVSKILHIIPGGRLSGLRLHHGHDTFVHVSALFKDWFEKACTMCVWKQMDEWSIDP